MEWDLYFKRCSAEKEKKQLAFFCVQKKLELNPGRCYINIYFYLKNLYVLYIEPYGVIEGLCVCGKQNKIKMNICQCQFLAHLY